MDRPARITDEEKLAALTAEEIRQLVEFYTEEEKDDLERCLVESNETLRKRVEENEEKISRERKINRLFLRKMWGVLQREGEELGEAAVFCKELDERIGRDDDLRE